MILKDFLPAAPLREWIRCYRIVHFHFDEPPPAKPYTPRPEQCLAFYPKDTEDVIYPNSNYEINKQRVVLIGQHTDLTQRYIGKDFLVIQVVFQPGALYRILGIPSKELVNQYMDASIFFGNNVHLINEQLYHAKNYFTMVDILDGYMHSQVSRSKKSKSYIEAVIKYFHQIDCKYSMEFLALQSYYSLKQFERNFILINGVGPKTYRRLVKFDHAFRIKNARPDAKWQEIAWQSGYTDYQHLAKDYKNFTSMSPASFHNLDTPEQKLGMAEGFYEIEMRQVNDFIP